MDGCIARWNTGKDDDGMHLHPGRAVRTLPSRQILNHVLSIIMKLDHNVKTSDRSNRKLVPSVEDVTYGPRTARTLVLDDAFANDVRQYVESCVASHCVDGSCVQKCTLSCELQTMAVHHDGGLPASRHRGPFPLPGHSLRRRQHHRPQPGRVDKALPADCPRRHADVTRRILTHPTSARWREGVERAVPKTTEH